MKPSQLKEGDQALRLEFDGMVFIADRSYDMLEITIYNEQSLDTTRCIPIRFCPEREEIADNVWEQIVGQIEGQELTPVIQFIYDWTREKDEWLKSSGFNLVCPEGDTILVYRNAPDVEPGFSIRDIGNNYVRIENSWCDTALRSKELSLADPDFFSSLEEYIMLCAFCADEAGDSCD